MTKILQIIIANLVSLEDEARLDLGSTNSVLEAEVSLVTIKHT